MNTLTPAAIEHIAADLVRRGLPIDYAQRAAAELVEHHHDLVAELCHSGFEEQGACAEASRRLGDASTLTQKTVREYQCRYWCGRWPLLTFLLGPVFTLAFAWIGAGVTLIAIGYLGKLCGLESDGRMDRGELLGSYGMWIAFTMLFPCLVAAIYWRLANRSAMAWPG